MSAGGFVLAGGDRAVVCVAGAPHEVAEAILHGIREDAELGEILVPSPAPDQELGGQFGGVLAVAQEFIVATGGGISAEAVIAAVRLALQRSRGDSRQASAVIAEDVAAQPRGDGVLEVVVTVRVNAGK